METIEVVPLLHRGNNRIGLIFPRNEAIIKELKKLNALWSYTHKMWYVDYNQENLQAIRNRLELIAIVNLNAFSNHIKQIAKHTELSTSLNPIQEAQKPSFNTEASETTPILNGIKPIILLDLEMVDKVTQFKSYLKSKRYSASTVITYTEALIVFLKFFQTKNIEEITNNDLITFNNEYILKKKLSASYQNQVINAVKLFFQIIQNAAFEINLVHRPKRSKELPNVLSKEEVKSILEASKNLKHKAMLSLIYSCGLRRGELLSLKPEHIDSKRNLLLIKQGKGKKDRIAPLGNKIIELLRTYFKVFKPKIYLFEGRIEGEPYDERSLQQVLKHAIEKVNIKKPVSLHWLRHSYATHLLENGTDLRYIQEILGHSSSRTTEIYTHVSTKNLQNISSPFDYL